MFENEVLKIQMFTNGESQSRLIQGFNKIFGIDDILPESWICTLVIGNKNFVPRSVFQNG